MATGSFMLRLVLTSAGLATFPAMAQETTTPPPRTVRVPALATPVRIQTPPPVLRIQPRQARQRQITPPASLATRQMRPSVTLNAGPDSALIQSLRINQQYSLARVRSDPIVTLGRARANMTPVLANPRALFNVARSIREQPQVAEVLADDTQFYEVDQGLLIRSFLTYRIKPGTCSDPARRGALQRGAISCSAPQTAQARIAAFANPRDPHFVRDAGRRSQAIATASQRAAAVEAELTSQVTKIRAALADPARRGEFVSEFGAEESARLATLSDDQIKAEIVNSGEISIEQTMFIPVADKLARASTQIQPAQSGPTMALIGTMNSGQPRPAAKPDPVAHTALDQRIFLTGFTLGREYEWKQRIEKTIKMCLIGCETTYYAEVFAGFNYGFGLRFPIQLGGAYDYKSGSASVTTSFTPINGTETDYAATGLAATQIFGGKELVAQIGAHAGAAYHLPIIGSNSIDIPVGIEFTDYLTGDFAHGQFTPPAPGAPNPPKMEKIFDTIDMIGGQANFGILGAQVFPAVRVELTSDSLNFTLHDFVKNTDTKLTASGQVTALGVDSKDNSSRFSIGDPVYNLGFLITPGIDARLFIDLALWSNSWDFPIWLPQLAIKLPPDGVNFGCHTGTVCSRNYRYSPTSHSEKEGAAAGFDADLEAWGNKFDATWLPECVDETCKLGIRFVRQGTILTGRHKHDANPDLKLVNLTAEFVEAGHQAKELVDDAQIRQTQKASNSFGILAQDVWSKRCSDKLCLDKVKGITKFYVLEINAQQKQNPEKSTNQIIGEVGKKYAPIYQAEIDKSKARAAAAAAPPGFNPAPGIKFNSLPKQQ